MAKDMDFITITDDTPENKISSSYIICTLPKSGSNLLMFTLRNQGIGYPHEYFNQNRVDVYSYLVEHKLVSEKYNLTHADWKPDFLQNQTVLANYSKILTQNRCSQNGVFGSKLFASDLHHSDENWTTLRKTLLPETKYIYLKRKNLISQSISMYFAAETNVWFEREEDVKKTVVPYSFENILFFFERLKKGYLFWEKLFSHPNPNFMVVTYAELAKNYTETIRSVNTFLGHSNLDIPPQSIKKQSNKLKAAYGQRFKRDLILHMKSQKQS